MRLIPDRRLENRNVEDLLRCLAGMYLPPLYRWHGRGFHAPDRAAWEILLTPQGADFHLSAPETWAPVVEKQLSVIWPRATVERVADPLAMVQPTTVTRFELKQHFLFALKTDRRSLGMLPSLLEVSRLLGPAQRVAVQVLLDPAPPDWWQAAAQAYEAFREGKMPRRLNLDAQGLRTMALRGLAATSLELFGILSELVSGQAPPAVDLDGTSKALALRERPIGANVAEKLRQDAFELTLRVGIEAEPGTAAQTLLRAVTYALRSLDDDNALAPVPEAPSAWHRVLRREPGLRLNRDYIGLNEAAMLVQMPTAPLQEEYRLTAVALSETNLPAAITQGGLRIGTATYRGKTVPVHLPTSDLDELCLPHVVIGGMGTGKTRGFGANLVVQAVKNGFGAVVIDPARGEIGDEVASALSPHQVVRIRFGQKPIALDWREATHSDRARNRLASELIAFVDAATDEAGAQTVRFLRAAAKAVPAGRLSEVVSLLTDDAYRAGLLPTMREQERLVWQQFDGLTPARQTQIALPVLNRLDVILGDDYLAGCMDTSSGIDFVKLLDEPRAIILDIPKAELGAEAVDVLAALVATKLDLAMVLRQSQHPVFVIQDEPHQYQRSARTWRAAAVESRKWRFSYVWMFHAWEQIPRDVGTIIQAAVPHYHLYTSSKATFKALKEEIAPLTVEEALRIPRHWALQIMQAGGKRVEPFLAKMDVPPSGTRDPAETCTL